ncbi:amino acid transporter [Yamadazyma tenuis]|uniref:Amino acid permease/ SLC12A domain-containing protein n=1 Tax=Candida tenuis (strain ATCC 10573 / BCRC 21748 / CBS 615 / JCM 9827 / NBRC 10315 / NRRL Y-1498 / VKM Y-70) TaxID=590646 RepID=G3B7I9_CANTC|nr:uncharacterized protein CANTEDRAFT_98820 [Yamadazyma tenuis ATCC 10573]EGV61627.1 hypothetical protein CANTEDRAFT_98820 [Yamadazyma tenuis ATCC 10573]WEJ92848.1 amino acid transporter [Yamadazyma tenuis]
MKDDHEKNIDSNSLLSRHTEDYNLTISRSNPSGQVASGHELKKGLHARHVSMIALGGALGTGLLIGTGSALKVAGPGAILLAYGVVGFVVFMVMSALGEVATFVPLADGFTGYSNRYVDPALGFACGYVYLFKYLIIPANQLVAGSLTVQYWVSADRLNPGVWITIFLIVILAINILGVRFFGEIEFWLSVLKVITCLGLIILLWVIALGGGPSHDRIGFRFWKEPGAFLIYRNSAQNVVIEGSLGRFVSFVSVLVNAVFAFLGTELCGITFAECRRPRMAIPKAIRLTFYRIVVFYLLSIFFLGMCVSPEDPLLLTASGSTASASPFVIAIKNAHISGLDHVINGCIMLFVLSAANSDMYICSRTVYGLAVAGYAPKFFSKTNRMGVPYYGVGLSFLFCLLAYMTVQDSASEVFQYFVNVVSLCGLLAWTSLLIIHIRFMSACKAQGVDRQRDLNYRSPLQPYGSWLALVMCVLIILIKNFTVFLGHPFPYKTFITGYVVLPVFLLFYGGFKLFYRTKLINSDEVDLATYKDVVDAEEESWAAEDEEAEALRQANGNPKNWSWFYNKIFGWIF